MKEKKIKMPYGSGSMSWDAERKMYIYRKVIRGKRVIVRAKTQKEAMRKMEKKEQEATPFLMRENSIFQDDIMRWLTVYNRSMLKQKSFDKKECIIKNQILKPEYGLYYRRTCDITSDDLMNLINMLVAHLYSYETVKKTHEVLKQFFDFFYIDNSRKNPMNRVSKPKKSVIQKENKEISFYDDEQIREFIRVAFRKYQTGKYVRKYGPGLVGLMFSGMRIGEALALRWKDIDFENRTIRIMRTYVRVIDRTEDGKKKEEHNRYKTDFNLPKTERGIRTVYMNEAAVQAFKLFKEAQSPASEDEYVFATSSGNICDMRNIERTIYGIQEEMGVDKEGVHILRHTYVSMMMRQKANAKVIAQNIGQHGTKMINDVYYHVTAEEMRESVDSISIPLEIF